MKYLKKGMSEENLKESDEKTKEIVSNTLKEIEEKGDKAVRNLSIKFDKWNPESFKLSSKQIKDIVSSIPQQVKDDIELEDYVGRAVIINGLGYMFFMFIILYLTNDNIYFILINLLGFFQILVVIINCFMVLYNKNKCGIADSFTKTRIEEIK